MTSLSAIPFAKPLTAALLTTMITVAPAMAQVTDHLGVPGPIEFDGTAYVLIWSSQPEAHYTKQEYLPAAQTLESYEQMLLIETVTGSLGVMDAVRAQVEMLNQRRQTDPLVNLDLIQNEASGEALLDFIVSDFDAEGSVIVEWNAYRYAPLADEDGNAGLLLFGVSHRAYGEVEARHFLETLGEVRSARIEALTQAPLPLPTD